jgi:16S rRNA (adenine(1408)-N(1))-methyltransferase
MAHESVEVVRGKQIITIEGQILRGAAVQAEHVIIDLGTGDGRWIYRVARRSPSWLCIGIDANAHQMRDVSFRAGRKLSRGGARNLWFVRSAVERLPDALNDLADEIHIQFPWRSLLTAIYKPDVAILAKIARMGKPEAKFVVRINASILDDPRTWGRGDVPQNVVDAPGRLERPYAIAGIRLKTVEVKTEESPTSWGRRLGSGHADHVVVLEGIVAKLSAPR